MASEPDRSRSREDLDREIEDLAAGKHCPQLDACVLQHTRCTCFGRVHFAKSINITHRAVSPLFLSLSTNLPHSFYFPMILNLNFLICIHVELPSKRRRTLVGSIASTALSAALIGSAVGLTVYRL